MINEFPHFTKLTLNHKQLLTKFVSDFEPYSDYNFTSLYSWNTDNSTEVALLNNNLVVKIPSYLTGEPIYSMIGRNKIDQSLNYLLAITPQLNLVPEVVINSINEKRYFNITEDIDNHDYIFKTESIIKLDGGNYKKKRNKIHKFKADFGLRIMVSNTMSPTQSEIYSLLKLFDQWAEENNDKVYDSKLEKIALDRLLQDSQNLNIIVTEIKLDNNIVGFSINELLPNGYAICHFEKAITIHENINSYISHRVALELEKHNIQYLNWEQDLGIAGLKQSKKSFVPHKYLKKYIVRKMY